MHENRKSLLLLFFANGISGFAQGVSMLSIPWYFAKNNNSQVFNYSYAALTFFIMFFGLYAGTLVDKFSRKNNFLFTSIICGLLIFSIAIIGYLNHGLPSYLIVAVFAITILNYNIHYPTLYAFGQEISSPEQYKSVNSNIEIVGQSTSILSGGFAAMLLDGFDINILNVEISIKAWQIYDVFMMDAITYFLAALLIYFIPYAPIKKITEFNHGIIERLKKGFTYLKEHQYVFIFGVSSYMVFAMLLVEIHAVLPTYIKQHLFAKGNVFALADTIYAVGALSAGFFINKLFDKASIVKVIVILTFLVAFIFIAAAISKSVLVIYIVSIILGFCNAGIRVLRLTYMFKIIPNNLMGRVGSIFNLINVLTRSIFIFMFSQSFFSISNNIIFAYVIMAIFLLIAGAILLFSKNKLATI
jgi:DHA3 family macrolide efflux protein-like MFS transporter